MTLEDSRDRIQRRLRDIRPGIRTNGQLRRYIASGCYRFIVIDVLARGEPAARGSNEKTYHDIYRMFAPLQNLHRQHPVCLVMVTHLRKAEAEDIFDTLPRLGGVY